MTTPTPMPGPSSTSAQLGALVAEYPNSQWRLIWVMLWAALAAWTVVGNIAQGSSGGVLVGIALGAGCYAYYYYYARYPVYAQVFAQGVVLSKGGKTTSARWEGVANVEHSVRTVRYDFIIPLYKMHSYLITLTNGGRVKVTSSFSKHRELGDILHRMWMEAAIERRARAIAQQQAAQ